LVKKQKASPCYVFLSEKRDGSADDWVVDSCNCCFGNNAYRIFILKDKGMNAIEYVRNILRFGR